MRCHIFKKKNDWLIWNSDDVKNQKKNMPSISMSEEIQKYSLRYTCQYIIYIRLCSQQLILHNTKEDTRECTKWCPSWCTVILFWLRGLWRGNLNFHRCAAYLFTYRVNEVRVFRMSQSGLGACLKLHYSL